MAAGYVAGGLEHRATFELSVRSLPRNRSFLVAAGLAPALEYLEALRFSPEDIAYLRSVPALAGVSAGFFDRYLSALRFSGEVWAVAEGTPIFAEEPLLTVTAPLPEAQIVETALLATIGFQTSIATKAARVVHAAAGRPVIEFGGRRAHGVDAAMYAARAAFVGGCDGTSNLEAGRQYGIPVSGTMAHSWVMAHAEEVDAFQRYAALFGERTVLLLDTYDTVEAARRIVAAGLRPSAVRLDSGDLVSLSRTVRQVLDDGGLRETKIFASGDLDEYRMAALVTAAAPIDGFGVGTALSTSSDAPALGVVYKLVEIERAGVSTPTVKLSEGKRTWPGRKQVWRCLEKGQAQRDVMGPADEAPPAGGEPLLQCVMRAGRRLAPGQSLETLRAHGREVLAQLPPGVQTLTGSEGYPVVASQALQTLAREAARRIGQRGEDSELTGHSPCLSDPRGPSRR